MSTTIEHGTDVATTGSGVRAEIESMTSGKPTMFSTLRGEDFETRKAVLASMINSVPIADHLDVPLKLRHVLVQAVELTDEEGMVNTSSRVTLITDDGTSYTGTSDGLFRSVRNILDILGDPNEWPEAVEIVVTAVKAARGKFFTVKLV